MLKTVKNGSGIRVDPPPVFFKIPTFSRFFGGGASLTSPIELSFCVAGIFLTFCTVETE